MKPVLRGFMLIALLVSFISGTARAQQSDVTGTVTDENSSPIPGVNVLIKGTSTGSITDSEGIYRVSVVNAESVLVFSFVGYTTDEVVVGNRTVIDFALTPDITALEEIVVIGYGSQKKSDLTGSIASINTAEIEAFPIARVDQALQGRATGVYVLNSDGAPGGNTMIRIRGNNSINGGNQPLVVIDGLQGGRLESLNPMDIKSIEILKDASATAIYGSRGANGVIIVTTKVGKIGKPVIDAGYNVGFQNLARKLPVMNAGEYAELYNHIRSKQTAGGNVPVPVFTDAEVAEYKQMEERIGRM